jgi:hypothetical protein
MTAARLSPRACVILALIANGCAPAEEDEPLAATCVAGQLSVGGACVAVGIQGCAAAFVGPDGVCRPTLDVCPKGTIPKFETGCVPVGIAGCAPQFVGADGTCRPSLDKCAPGQYALPLEGCVPIDRAGCGTGTWGDVPDGPSTVWVDAAFAGASDGSRDKPVKTLAAALALVPSGGRVVVAAGDYAEPLEIAKPVEIAGRCPSLVHVHGITPKLGLDAVVAVTAQGVTLRSLRIGGAGIGVYAVNGGAKLIGVHVDGATLAGAAVAGAKASMSFDHCLVRGTAGDAQGEYGQALEVMQGAHATVLSSAFVENRRIGIGATDAGTELTVDKSVIEHTRSQTKGKVSGRGIEVAAGASVIVTSSALVANRDIGVIAADPGTKVQLSHSVIADTQAQESDDTAGRGIQAQTGATLDVAATAVVGNRDAGAYSTGTGALLHIDGSLVADTVPNADQLTRGDGIAIDRGAASKVSGCAVVHNHSNGIVAGSFDEQGAQVDVASTLVADTQLRSSDGKFGRGVNIRYESAGAVRDSVILGNHQVGIGVNNASTIAVSATLVEGTLPIADGSYGVGLAASRAAKMAIRGALIRNNQGVGVLAVDTVYPGVSVQGVMSIEQSVIDGVSPGRFYQLHGSTIDSTYDGIADGVVAFAANPLTMKDVWIRGCGRAAVVFDGTSGKLRGVRADAGHFGLVAQNLPKPDWSDAGNSFAGGVQAVLTDGALPVPGAPPTPK